MTPLESTSTIGGRYALCGEIASGGMATVHLARQLGAAGFARIVAVKRLHARYARDPDFVAMFLDEAWIVARVRHPNVVQTIDVVADAGELFLVMEYVPGASLLHVLQVAHRSGVTLPISFIAAAIVGALHGLHEAHESRGESGQPLAIVHRDVSPHNILVGLDGIARVLDFGVAKASQRIQSTHEGELKGKLSYMAPEQITNGPVDRRTDVYAAGVVLWEALAGEKLFQGASEAAVLNKILLDPPRRPSTPKRLVPAALEAIVLRALAHDPTERFGSAREMARAIESATSLASATEVGALVSSLCGSALQARADLVASVEMRTSLSSRRQAVDSLRSLATSSRGTLRAAGGGLLDSDAPVAMPPVGEPVSGRGATQSKGALAAVVAGAVLFATMCSAAGYFVVANRAARVSATAALAAPATSSTSTSTSTTCPDGMALVPAGRFFMGSDDDLPAEKPAHKVTIHALCMDKLEVTTNAYRACSDRGDCKRAGSTNRWAGITVKESRVYDPLCNAQESRGLGDHREPVPRESRGLGDHREPVPRESRGLHPINCVDWNMADRFCRAEGKRLPTEAEWEYAARGSDGRKYPWGDTAPSPRLLNACGPECVGWGKRHGTLLEGMFNEPDAWTTTAPVGSFPLGASRWGLEDMVGNVWEWVADYYAPYGEADQEAPVGPATGATRAMRGGAWNGAHADWVRPTFRFHDAPDTRSHGVGFRCARDR